MMRIDLLVSHCISLTEIRGRFGMKGSQYTDCLKVISSACLCSKPHWSNCFILAVKLFFGLFGTESVHYCVGWHVGFNMDFEVREISVTWTKTLSFWSFTSPSTSRIILFTRDSMLPNFVSNQISIRIYTTRFSILSVLCSGKKKKGEWRSKQLVYEDALFLSLSHLTVSFTHYTHFLVSCCVDVLSGHVPFTGVIQMSLCVFWCSLC